MDELTEAETKFVAGNAMHMLVMSTVLMYALSLSSTASDALGPGTCQTGRAVEQRMGRGRASVPG
eukprot:10724941-Lingulodinium_polyedra.AAC.1